jgi:hypothetical protein
MSEAASHFTAAQISAALGISPQAVRQQLRDIPPADKLLAAGNEAAAWTVDQFPPRLRERLAIESTQQKCSIDTLLRLPRRQWQPSVAMSNIAPENIRDAEKLREALKPFLMDPAGAGLTAEEWKQRGADYYFRVFFPKLRITPHQWDRLFRRTQERDNGVQNWDSIQIYLSDRLKRKHSPVTVPAASQDFVGLENYLRAFKVPGRPDKLETVGVWSLALTAVNQLVIAGENEKRAERRVRQFLFTRAVFPGLTKHALWIAFKRKIAALKKSGRDPKAIEDGRTENGERVDIPAGDIDRLRHSAVLKNGKRIDAAWREEYPLLSEATRQRHPYSFKAPPKVHKLLNRELVDALWTEIHDKRKLRQILPSIRRDWTGVYSMHSWVVDDLTANLQVCLKDNGGKIVMDNDGKPYLFTPQVIAVMDSASRKFVGWTGSTAKAPNARIVTDAVKEGFKLHGVPKCIGVENGFVFGKSALVNGKEDEFGNTLVVGLGHFGCEMHHFEKRNPRSKSEIEFGFEQLQRLMERHPGYTGRRQMLDAPEKFKQQEILIKSGKVEATKFRYTFVEFIDVLNEIFFQYNATPQNGRLKGLSPDQAFEFGKNASEPPIRFTPEIEWMLSDRALVPVKIGGVNFKYRSTGEKIRVTGGPLLNFIGQELWALMDPRDTSIVTFMNQDYTNTFTMEVLPDVHGRERDFDPGSKTMAKARAMIHEQERGIRDANRQLKNQFGDPNLELLAKRRGQTNAPAGALGEVSRRVIVNPRIKASGAQFRAQRAEITGDKEQKARRIAANKNKARRLGIPAILVDDDPRTREALEMLRDSPQADACGVETSEGSEQ